MRGSGLTARTATTEGPTRLLHPLALFLYNGFLIPTMLQKQGWNPDP
jgi:hypothetical protein